MFCPHCGNTLPDGSIFCGKSGAQLSASSAPPMGSQNPAGAGAWPGGGFAAGPGMTPGGGYAPGMGSQPGGGFAPGSMTGVPGNSFGGPQNRPKKAPVALIVAAVAVVAIVGLVIFGVSRCVGGGGGRSAQDVANSVDAIFAKFLEDDFSSGSMADGVDQMIDLLPPEMVDSMMEGSGFSREELREEVESAFGPIDQYSSYLSMIDFDVEVTLGDELGSSELDSINSSLEDYDVSSSASEGYYISLDVEVSAMGQSDSQQMDESGLYAICLDGGWYLWMNM